MKYFTVYLSVSSQQYCAMMVHSYKLFSRHSWYIAIAHIHFFWSACKARNFNPISRVEIAWLVCWWCDGWRRSQYSARLVSKICIKYLHTGIPRFMLLMWGHKSKNRGSKNRVNRGHLDDGWRSQYSARLVSKICIKYKLEIKTSCLSFCSRIW